MVWLESEGSLSGSLGNGMWWMRCNERRAYGDNYRNVR